MVSSVTSRPWFYVTVGGATVDILHEYTQTEALVGSLSRVLQFDVADTSALVTGQSITMQAIDRQANTAIDQFAGTVNNIRGTGFPNQVTITSTGPLTKLRRTRPDDIDLSGMSEQEAVWYILSYCGVPFFNADVGGNGYILGQRVPVIWAAGTSGAEMLAEFDRVFGYATIEVGNGRVVRFSYDLVPNPGDISITFSRANSALYYGAERTLGDIDAIQNYWQITGVTYDCDECQCTIYANAQANHPKLGAGVFVAPQSFTSELIQDENLAAAIATRMMRWYNREPDIVYIETANNAQVSPGLIVGVTDSAYGIDLLTQKPYLITNIDRRGDLMRLTGIGGTAGDVGTVTSGAERVCNDISTNIPDPPDLGGFPGFPAFPGMPPLPPIGIPNIDPPEMPQIQTPQTVMPSGGECTMLLTTEGWTDPSGDSTWALDDGVLIVRHTAQGVSRSYLPTVEIPQNTSWRLTGSFKLLQEHTALTFGVGMHGEVFDMKGGYAHDTFNAIFNKEVTVFLEEEGTDPFLNTSTFYSFILEWYHTTKILRMRGQGTMIEVEYPDIEDLWNGPMHPILSTNMTSSGDTGLDAFVFQNLQLCIFEGDDDGGDILATERHPYWETNDFDVWGPEGSGSITLSDGEATWQMDSCDASHLGWGAGFDFTQPIIPTVGVPWEAIVEGWIEANGAHWGINFYDASYTSFNQHFVFGADDPPADLDLAKGWEWGSGYEPGLEHALVTGEANPFRFTLEYSLDEDEQGQWHFTWESPIGTMIYDENIPDPNWEPDGGPGYLNVQVVFFTDSDSPGGCSAGTGKITKFIWQKT